MIRKLNIRWIKWIDWVNLWKTEIYKVLKKYNFHELDVEACYEDNQRARIDSYDDYFFMVLHFPKYDTKKQIYETNEFNIFIWKNFLITFRNFNWNHIDKIFEKYAKLDIEDNEQIKFSSGFILYEIIQAMLEKMFTITNKTWIDLKKLEKEVFSKTTAWLVKRVMIKKRNISYLKYMFFPQVSVMKLLEYNLNKLFKSEIEEYFEDLEDKIEYIVNELKILQEYADSIEDAYKSIIDIKTNNVMTFLTIFSTFLLPLTLITSFYWMNTDPLPFLYNNITFVYSSLIFSIFIMIIFFYYLKKKWKI